MNDSVPMFMRASLPSDYFWREMPEEFRRMRDVSSAAMFRSGCVAFREMHAALDAAITSGDWDQAEDEKRTVEDSYVCAGRLLGVDPDELHEWHDLCRGYSRTEWFYALFADIVLKLRAAEDQAAQEKKP